MPLVAPLLRTTTDLIGGLKPFAAQGRVCSHQKVLAAPKWLSTAPGFGIRKLNGAQVIRLWPVASCSFRDVA
jgi:hypothetical protein